MKIDPARIADFQIHPLGFYYLVLSSGKSTSRLHIYNGKVDFAANNEWHTHEFDLHSEVLVGELRNEIGQFRIEPNGTAKEFIVEYQSEKSKLRQTGLVGEISRVVDFTTVAGQTYFIGAGTIHRAIDQNIPCVTHVKLEHRNAKIFSYGSPETPFHRRRVNTEELDKISKIFCQNDLLSTG